MFTDVFNKHYQISKCKALYSKIKISVSQISLVQFVQLLDFFMSFKMPFKFFGTQ